MKDFFELKLKIKETSQLTTNFTEFEVQPLVQGFATTIGNSLRRTLLTSVLGAAIYAFRINKVEQEFQNLTGCAENVVQISLNIQKIIVAVDHKVFPDPKEKITLHLKVKGAETVLAKHLQLPAGVTIINPEQEIVNIVKANYALEMEFFVVQGRGFSNFQDNKLLTKGEIGTFTLSANFSHVLRVAVKTEEIKVGQQDVSEKLVLGIETNGAITPVAALVNAARILSAHLQYFTRLDEVDLVDFTFAKSKVEDDVLLNHELKNLDFSERTINSLEAAGIQYLDQLRNQRKSDLLKLKNLGQKSLKEIVDKLKQDYKLTLKD